MCSSKERFNIKTDLCESRTVRSVTSWRFRANRAQNVASAISQPEIFIDWKKSASSFSRDLQFVLINQLILFSDNEMTNILVTIRCSRLR